MGSCSWLSWLAVYCGFLGHPLSCEFFCYNVLTSQGHGITKCLLFTPLLSLQAFCFVGIVVMSYATAFIVSVSVEFPMMQLEKLIFRNDP